MAQWRTVLLALYRVLNHQPAHPQPAHRLHYRLSSDETQVIVEAEFDRADVDVEDLARLPAYISNALDGAFTPAQVRDAMRNRVTVWGSGRPWMQSGDACRQYLAEHCAEWQVEG